MVTVLCCLSLLCAQILCASFVSFSPACILRTESTKPWAWTVCLQLPREASINQAHPKASHRLPQCQRGNHRKKLWHWRRSCSRLTGQLWQTVCDWRLHWLCVTETSLTDSNLSCIVCGWEFTLCHFMTVNCICVCVCVISVIVKHLVLTPCTVDGRFRNPLYYYYRLRLFVLIDCVCVLVKTICIDMCVCVCVCLYTESLHMYRPFGLCMCVCKLYSLCRLCMSV